MSYNPYKRYSSYWWRYWLNVPADVIWFFKRIWLYRELLWKDNDYDYGSILHIARFKLTRLRKHIEEHAMLAHSEDRIAELAKVDVLLRNVIDEDPDDEWGMHCSQWHLYDKKGWNMNKCGAKKECYKACMAGRRREERNWHELWAYIDKNMRNWWD